MALSFVNTNFVTDVGGFSAYTDGAATSWRSYINLGLERLPGGDYHPMTFHVMACDESGTVIGKTNWEARGTSQFNTTQPLGVQVGVGENEVLWASEAEADAAPLVWTRGWHSGPQTAIGTGAGFWWNHTDAAPQTLKSLIEDHATAETFLIEGDSQRITHAFEYGAGPTTQWYRDATYVTGAVAEGDITFHRPFEFTGPPEAYVDTVRTSNPWKLGRQVLDFDIEAEGVGTNLYLSLLWADHRNIPGTQTYDTISSQEWKVTDGSGRVSMSDGPWIHRPLWFAAYTTVLGFRLSSQNDGEGTNYATYTFGDTYRPVSPVLPAVVNARPRVRLRLGKSLSLDGGAP